ncbi:hypothetical protein ABVT39_005304 [Epinephelus coioides]
MSDLVVNFDLLDGLWLEEMDGIEKEEKKIHCVSYTPSAPHLWYRQPTRLRLKVRIRFQPSSVPTARKTSNSSEFETFPLQHTR